MPHGTGNGADCKSGIVWGKTFLFARTATETSETLPQKETTRTADLLFVFSIAPHGTLRT